MTYISEINRNKELIETINLILNKHNITEKIILTDITITENTVTDSVKEESKLSDAIINLLWPRISQACVYHYTSRESAENILGSGIFRLTNIEKRYNEGEIIAFCNANNLKGYLSSNKNGDPIYKSLLMPNTFYASFTDTKIDSETEEYFWSTFTGGDGVRLKFDIQAKSQNFTRIIYENPEQAPLGILQELTNEIRNKYNLEFILKGISRLCSFYLPSAYKIENEYRLLYRYWETEYLKPNGTGPNSYVEIPLNTENESGFKLNISEVHAKTKINMPSIYTFSKRN